MASLAYGTEVFVRSVVHVVEDPQLTSHNLGFLLLLTDLFLIGATLMIAAFGFYDLFIGTTGASRSGRRLPGWLRMHDLNDLKARVISMIILVAAVTFVDVVVESKGGDVDTLYLGAAEFRQYYEELRDQDLCHLYHARLSDGRVAASQLVLTGHAVTHTVSAAADAGDVPGVVATAANADGVIFEGAVGTRDLATGAPMTTDTVVWIASMTKAVTGACAMQLVEQGKLSLDGDIGRTLPELGRVQVLVGFDTDGKPRLRSPKRAVSVSPARR